MLFITFYGALNGCSHLKEKKARRRTQGWTGRSIINYLLMSSYYFPLNERRQLRTSLDGGTKDKKTSTLLSWQSANKAWPNGLFLFASVTTLSTRSHPSHSVQIATICAIIAVKHVEIIDLFMAFRGADEQVAWVRGPFERLHNLTILTFLSHHHKTISRSDAHPRKSRSYIERKALLVVARSRVWYVGWSHRLITEEHG